MEIFQAIFLGIIQGLTEFLPISSQAHLLLVPYFLKWDYQGLGFDVGLHWGTLAAVFLVFGKDYWRYIRAVLTPSSSLPSLKGGGERLIAWFLVIGTIPAAAAGYLFKKQAETMLRNPLITIFTLVIFAFLLWLADRNSSSISSLIKEGEGGSSPPQALNWKKSLFIGLFQAIAIIPGVSRSGATMAAGMFSGLNRESAARFSFLLSGPIIFGAGLVAFKDFIKIDTIMIVGFLASALAGFAAIKFLLNYLASRNFTIFVWYRYVLAAVVLLTFLLR